MRYRRIEDEDFAVLDLDKVIAKVHALRARAVGERHPQHDLEWTISCPRIRMQRQERFVISWELHGEIKAPLHRKLVTDQRMEELLCKCVVRRSYLRALEIVHDVELEIV